MSELLQAALLSQPCTADDLDIAVRYQPAEPEAQVGGDWYDAFVDASGATILTVADVSGHDHNASVTMGQVHVPPLLRDPEGIITRLEVEPDLLLGISPDTPRFDHAIDLEAGSTLLLYTDGLVERRDVDFDDGIDNLATTLSNVGDLDPDPLCDAIIESTAALEAGDDDIALLVLRFTG
jgi:serine phosphatase RsbU (regulator of sigma subunit)